MTFDATLDQAFKARLPLLYVETSEEMRLQEAVGRVAGALRKPRALWTWTASAGLVDAEGAAIANTTNPVRALDHALGVDDDAVFLFCDLHAFLGAEHRPGDPAVIRKIRETAADFRGAEQSKTLMISAPVRVIPAEIDKVTTLLDFPLPGRAELRALLDSMIESNSDGGVKVEADEKELEQLVQAALGLTMLEAENALARAMVDDARLSKDDVAIVLEEKRQTVKKAGLLEFVDSHVDLEKIGGLNNLKRWLGRRDGAWLSKAEDYGLPAPKGVLITGVPGCGKSLTAKATAASWGVPLLRLDIGRVFSGLVGSSEQNLRTAIATAEATAPCILWVDEIEKGFSGNTQGAGQLDSGTSARVFGYFLTWMQEKSKPVFVVATANNIDALPPEFMRKGRFDEIFFVDLPTHREREQIWAIQLDKNATDANGLAALATDAAALTTLAAASDDFSGAEIEQAVVGAMYEGFAHGRAVTPDDLALAVSTTVPLAVTQAERIAAIRQWASMRAVLATGSEDIVAEEKAEPSKKAEPAKLPSHRGGRTVDF
ncbi:AAA family ATPase [Pseudolysinimonas sp.]|jgi:SpoVK/Ycf46/Vps4 family AAA+-type ATPase|uniref:AAA family ATPase n=1 Tax=Pseudolysinimonas sp. TaxID=2680009 RepID=UPI0037838938